MLIIVLKQIGSAFAGMESNQEDDSWISLYPRGKGENKDLFFHARLMASSGTMGAYAVRSYSEEGDNILTSFASASTRAWSLDELRNDNSPVANRLRAVWKDERSQEQIGGSVPKISLLRRMAL